MLDILSLGGDKVADNKKTSKHLERDSKLDRYENDDRHNDNARTATAFEPVIPRIDTENL
jgi:hypothetical protein